MQDHLPSTAISSFDANPTFGTASYFMFYWIDFVYKIPIVLAPQWLDITQPAFDVATSLAPVLA
ncbi:hypothetical protein SAMN04488542_109134 [Fontibacillus panacisegetis]|uniref:Uncharacterized protein n=1 Tax=Fontibacillus panacisegetis TaxID=670482 RepID=A0A1G7KGM7_9BACL|nr:hypothetical protein SAMN04488542_109134 [Fontibacillus panacisegetis]